MTTIFLDLTRTPVTLPVSDTNDRHKGDEMAALTKNFDKITGRFACVYGGIRTEEFTHEWSKEAGGVIQSAPADVTAWLMLADRLEEECNPAHIVIRAAFEPGYVPPAGFTGELHRGGRYMENGQHYSEGVTLRWEAARCEYGDGAEVVLPAGFVFSYWSGNGNCVRNVETAEVRELLAGAGRRTTWCSMRAEGVTVPTVRVIPVGATVEVYKRVGHKVRPVNQKYRTNEGIPVPAAVVPRWEQTAIGEQRTYVATFDYKGFVVRVPIAAVEVA